ncbi:DUF4845 domain-containing protein [Halothiobacillus sp.]|jgi:hypothetical protein|uniref:DUF4845 domain-containing protein n=1 Tax=Halothiobacillus sp. TaxID=1891311 RepID=UPI00260B85BF|nr:DUF4845 domain-containing protein [Halothiobacillus sp.]MDD3575273.1 DUF4845 domain-containing protein [Halothiobacillus sp.]MDD4966569.1 DUF4845 domain-containing protein [Halothiobacillus sp.]MDY0146428.1 DUF4845 domain-containing protein [Halothiobacillus sp.]
MKLDHSTASRRHQSGMTLIGLIMYAFIAFFLAILLMKVVPLYLTDQKISSIFKQLQSFHGDPMQIRSTIDKQLDINEIDNITSKDFKITPFGNGYKVTYDYDGRADIVGNLAVVASFTHSVNVSP